MAINSPSKCCVVAISDSENKKYWRDVTDLEFVQDQRSSFLLFSLTFKGTLMRI